MPDWKRWVVGDAFALDSRNKNFYRDMFLLVPFLLFAIMAVSGLFAPKQDFPVTVKCFIASVWALALMRERLLLVGACLGFVCVQSGVSFVLKRDPLALAVSILSGAVCLVLIRKLKDYKPNYAFERNGTIATLLVVMAGGVCWYAIFRLLVEPH